MTIASGPIGNGPIGSSGGANYVLSVTHGTFTLSMQGAGKLITDIYPSGQFALSGQALLNPVSLNIGAEEGVFTYTGSTVAVSLGKGIFLEPIGTFASTGHAVSFQANLSPDAAPGTFTVTGQDQEYAIDISIIPPAATFTLTGQPATFGFVLDPTTATFTLTGPDVVLSAGRTLSIANTESYTYQGYAVVFRGWFTPVVPSETWTEAA
jgi:hypothetical protein|tara:strand:- start:1297 stop:1923 length:627 start_codon:yes stop_codon:yes gene_type:complete